MNFTEEFHEGLANLFYAVSMADKNMTVEEKKSIVKRVEKNWSNSDNSGSEQVYETLRSLVKDKLSSEEAYENFKNYYLTHQEEFPKDVIHNLLVAAHEISNSTAGKNKSELIILAKLYKLFKLA